MAGYLETQDLEDLEGMGFDGEGGFDGESDGEGILDIVGSFLGESDGEDVSFEGGDLEGYLGEGGEFEDLEADPFIGDLIKTAARTVTNVAKSAGVGAPLLKTLAQKAAQVAGGAIAGPTGAQIASQIANRVLREGGGEYESDASFETSFASLGGDHEILEEMNYWAAMAAETANDQEADQFIGAIASLAGPLLSGLLGGSDGELGHLYEGDGEGLGEYDPERDEFIPLLAAALPAVLPLVKKGIGAVGKALRRSPHARPALRALPRMAARTGMALARQSRAGRRPTPQRVAATMGQQAARTLGSRPALSAAMRANRAGAARAQARPSVRPRTNGGARPMIAPRTNGAAAAYASPAGYNGGTPRRRGRVIGYVPVLAVRR